jgi:hypothetical protein
MSQRLRFASKNDFEFPKRFDFCLTAAQRDSIKFVLQ